MVDHAHQVVGAREGATTAPLHVGEVGGEVETIAGAAHRRVHLGEQGRKGQGMGEVVCATLEGAW